MKAVDLTVEQIDLNRARAIALFRSAIRAYGARSRVRPVIIKENAYTTEIKALVTFTGLSVVVWIAFLLYLL